MVQRALRREIDQTASAAECITDNVSVLAINEVIQDRTCSAMRSAFILEQAMNSLEDPRLLE